MVATAQTSDQGQALDALLSRLPAQTRAAVGWLPVLIRDAVVDPLSQATPAEVFDVAHEAGLTLLQRMPRLIQDTSKAFSELIQLFAEEGQLRDTIHARISDHLGGHPREARQLHEAFEWFLAIQRAVSEVVSLESALKELEESLSSPAARARLEKELDGPGGYFWRGLVLTIAAIEVVDRVPLPASFPSICRLALSEQHAAANALRAEGLAVPLSVHWNAGLNNADSANLWVWPLGRAGLHRSRVPEPLLKSIVEVLDPIEIWLFGSRARGDYGPHSDWDLLVVVDQDRAESAQSRQIWSQLREARRHNADVLTVGVDDFRAARDEVGTLAHIVADEGVLVHER